MLNECCNRFLHSCNMHVSFNMRGFDACYKHVTCMTTSVKHTLNMLDNIHNMLLPSMLCDAIKVCGSVVGVN